MLAERLQNACDLDACRLCLPFVDRCTCGELMLPYIQGPITECCILQLLLPDCRGQSRHECGEQEPCAALVSVAMFELPPVISYSLELDVAMRCSFIRGAFCSVCCVELRLCL